MKPYQNIKKAIVLCTTIRKLLQKTPTAALIDANSDGSTTVAFEYKDNTSVHKSCSMTFKNTFWVFGGGSGFSGTKYGRQLSKVEGKELVRVADLAFDLDSGACTNFNDERVILCFSRGASSGGGTVYSSHTEQKTCRQSSDPRADFAKVAMSLYRHSFIRIASSKSKLFKGLASSLTITFSSSFGRRMQVAT